MLAGSLEFGNYVLILFGVVLFGSGPVIMYQTVRGIILRRKENPSASFHLFSTLLNFLIAVLFFLAGVLFVVNNLRGNPLAAS